jgi:Holliday junction resolvase
MLERTIERRLVDKAKEAGGMAVKWTAPGFSGVPDRIVFMPGGRIIFIELKAPGKTLAPIQARVHKMLADLGVDVRVIDSTEGVDGVFK